MSKTTSAGDVHTIFGINVTATILAIVDDHSEDFDLEAAANGYRDYLDSFLPDGYGIHGNMIMKDVGKPELDCEQVRQNVADDAGEGFDISKYATHDKPDDAPSTLGEMSPEFFHAVCGPEDPKGNARSSATATFDVASNLVGAARTLAMQGTAQGYRDAKEQAENGARAFRAAATLYDIAGDVAKREYCYQVAANVDAAAGNYLGIATSLANVDTAWAEYDGEARR